MTLLGILSTRLTCAILNLSLSSKSAEKQNTALQTGEQEYPGKCYFFVHMFSTPYHFLYNFLYAFFTTKSNQDESIFCPRSDHLT